MYLLSAILQDGYLGGMYPLCMIVSSNGQGNVLPEEEVSDGYMPLLRGKTVVFYLWLWRIVLRLQQEFDLQLAPQ